MEGNARVAELEPALRGGSVLGAVYAPSSAHIEPMQATVAIAEAARTLFGTQLLEDTTACALDVRDGGGWNVHTVQRDGCCERQVLQCALIGF